MEYNVCTSSDLQTLIQACDQWIANGWRPQGGIAMTFLAGSSKIAYAQAFTR